MIYPVYCIRDTKVGFNPEFIVQMNEQASIRSFKFMMDKVDSMTSKFPEDYEWYHVCNFDTESGQVESIIPPKFICSGGAILEK